MTMKPFNPFFIITVILIVSGCITTPTQFPKAMPPSIQLQPAVSPFFAPPIPAEGSLWTDSSRGLFEDNRARRVGDTVIVDIVENSSSKLDANTETTRDVTMSAGIPSFFGAPEKLVRKHTDLNPSNLISATVGNSFKGEATSDRKGQVTATIAARVTEVFPNGNIRLYGKREMKVNYETQYIIVTGIIRKEDIDSTNHVKSTYLADARIEYSGKGVLAEKQKVGWLTRIFDHVWPF